MKVPLHLGAFHSAERVLGPSEKKAIGLEHRSAAVDMESATLRSWAEAKGATFVGVRAVFDALGERAPEAGPADASAAAALRFAAEHWGELPRLLRLWPRQVRGMSRLGNFLARWFVQI